MKALFYKGFRWRVTKVTKKHLILVYEYTGGGTPTRLFFLTLYIFVVTVVTKARKALFYKDFRGDNTLP